MTNSNSGKVWLRLAQEFFTYMETSPIVLCSAQELIFQRWRAVNLGAQGLWAGRDLYHYSVSSEGPPYSVAYNDTLGYVEDLFYPHGAGPSINYYSFTSRSRIFQLYGVVTIASECTSRSRIVHLHGDWIDWLFFFVPLKNFWIFIMPHLRFSGLIRRTAPFSRLLRHTRVGSILARILTGPGRR
jgi:hypothetical protein